MYHDESVTHYTSRIFGCTLTTLSLQKLHSPLKGGVHSCGHRKNINSSLRNCTPPKTHIFGEPWGNQSRLRQLHNIIAPEQVSCIGKCCSTTYVPRGERSPKAIALLGKDRLAIAYTAMVKIIEDNSGEIPQQTRV